jgi:hypothetical protein
VPPISVLAKVFQVFVPRAVSGVESVSLLSVRVSALEQGIIAEAKESIVDHDRQLEALLSAIETTTATLRTEIDSVRHSVEKTTSQCEVQNERLNTRMGTVERRVSLLNEKFDGAISHSWSEVRTRLSLCEQQLKPISPAPVLPESIKEVQCPLKEDKSLDGIISYLTRKHGGNVHDKGIVAITSKSVRVNTSPFSAGPVRVDYSLRKIADLTTKALFVSGLAPDQWVCWDFRDMRLRPTHYTIGSCHLKSWVVESSLDFVNWTEIDRKTDNKDLKEKSSIASFAVSNSAEGRYLRLTQTGRTHNGATMLIMCAFEIFGTLIE